MTCIANATTEPKEHREIEVTAEMIEAGAAEVAAHGREDCPRVTAFMVFTAMCEVANIKAIETPCPKLLKTPPQPRPKREGTRRRRKKSPRSGGHDLEVDRLGLKLPLKPNSA